MAFKAGTASVVYIANAANALQNLSPYIDNTSWQNALEQLEVSAFGTAAKAFIPGLTGSNISVSGPADATMSSHLAGLYAAQSAGSGAAGIIYGPGGSVASQTRFAGSIYVSDYSVSSSVGGRVEYSASLQITGAVAMGTF